MQVIITREGRHMRRSRRAKIMGLVLCVTTLWLAALASGPAVGPSAQAAPPCHVPSGTYPTIQAAVHDATCATINVAAGTYTELVTILRNLTIHGEGQERTVVDGRGRGPVFVITNSTVTINGVTIQNGEASSAGGRGIFGGGIRNDGTLTIENSTFSNNSALRSGGGIFNGGTLTVKNSTFAGNRAPLGGGIFNGGTLIIENSTLSGNRALESGGGIFNGGMITLTHVTFENNATNDCLGCP
jgi:predicted outer membrane repeat protein